MADVDSGSVLLLLEVEGLCGYLMVMNFE